MGSGDRKSTKRETHVNTSEEILVKNRDRGRKLKLGQVQDQREVSVRLPPRIDESDLSTGIFTHTGDQGSITWQ